MERTTHFDAGYASIEDRVEPGEMRRPKGMTICQAENGGVQIEINSTLVENIKLSPEEWAKVVQACPPQIPKPPAEEHEPPVLSVPGAPRPEASRAAGANWVCFFEATRPDEQTDRELVTESMEELRLYEDANAASNDDAEHHLRAALILTLRALAAHLGVQP